LNTQPIREIISSQKFFPKGTHTFQYQPINTNKYSTRY